MDRITLFKLWLMKWQTAFWRDYLTDTWDCAIHGRCNRRNICEFCHEDLD